MVLPVPYARRMTEDRPAVTIPEHGRAPDELLAEIEAMHAGDIDWRGGRAFSLVYNPGDEELEHLLEEVGRTFLHDNALNPFKYPSLLRMEQEVIAMACGLFGAAARRRGAHVGRHREHLPRGAGRPGPGPQPAGIAEPQLLTAATAHPAFAKAAKYLDVEHVLVPVGDDGRADVAATVAAIDDAHRARRRVGALLPVRRHRPDHRDRRRGGGTRRAVPHRRLPRRLAAAVVGAARQPVPPWDFRVPGVTSHVGRHPQVRLHVQGRVDVIYRSPGPAPHQFFRYDDWPGGLYASGTVGRHPARRRRSPARGRRSTTSASTATCAWPGGARRHHAVSGRASPPSTALAITGDARHVGLRVRRRPDPTPSTWAASATSWTTAGWNLDRQQGGLHLMVSPYHARSPTSSWPTSPTRSPSTAEPRKAATYGGVA